MKIMTVLSLVGTYNRRQFIISQLIISLLIAGFIWLIFVNPFFSILSVPVCVLLVCISFIAAIKRLHDLGYSSKEYTKPFFTGFNSINLVFSPGKQREKERDC
jgi:hypothetical protein